MGETEKDLTHTSLAERMLGLYERIDRSVGAFANASGLKCPPGCGECCTNPHIEVVESDMLVMAQALVTKGLGESTFRRLEAMGESGDSHCVMFQPGSKPGQGRCLSYEERPSLCRLFGFAKVHTKEKSETLATCRVHKPMINDSGIGPAIDRALPMAPAFSDIGQEIAGLDPARGIGQKPINAALMSALSRCLLRRDIVDMGRHDSVHLNL